MFSLKETSYLQSLAPLSVYFALTVFLMTVTDISFFTLAAQASGTFL